MKAEICLGVSGAGKSTYAQKFLDENPRTIRINRDSLRESFFGDMEGYYSRPFIRDREEIVTEISKDLIVEASANGFNLIVDNTNTEYSRLDTLVNMLEALRFNIKIRLFEIDPEEAKYRVLKRDHGFTGEKSEMTEEMLLKVLYINKQTKQLEQTKAFVLDRYPKYLEYDSIPKEED